MFKYNTDMMPDHAVRALFEGAGSLVANDRIVRAFSRYEKQAALNKRRYHGLGRVGMSMTLASALFTVAEAIVIPPFSGLWLASLVAVLIGIVGLGLQICLILSRIKHRWLIARFGAERVRSIAFQAYALAVRPSEPDEQAAAVDRFYEDALVRLETELNTGIGAFALYSPTASLAGPLLVADRDTEMVPPVVRAAYRELRLEHQRRFTTSELSRLQEQREVGERLGDILYVMGGGLAVAALAIKVLAPHAMASAWVDFAAICSFIVGLSVAVFDGATLSAPSAERYLKYRRDLDAVAQAEASGQSFLATVRDTETLALEELAEFCKSASKISYRL